MSEVDERLRTALGNELHAQAMRMVIADFVKSGREHGVNDLVIAVELLSEGLAVLMGKTNDEARVEVMRMVTRTAENAVALAGEPAGRG